MLNIMTKHTPKADKRQAPKPKRAATAPPIRPQPPAVRFWAYLEAQVGDIRKNRSGEKSTLKLLAAGGRLLETNSFRDLKVGAICDEAGLAKGSFYIYFTSKEIFSEELARRYIDFEGQTYPSFATEGFTFANACTWVSWYERTFSANAGVIRCIVEESTTSQQMRDLWHKRNRMVSDGLLADALRRFKTPPANPELVRLAIRTTGGMLDQSLFERHRINVGPGLLQDYPDSTLIELHAVLCYRAIYGCNPPEDEVFEVRELLDIRPPL